MIFFKRCRDLITKETVYPSSLSASRLYSIRQLRRLRRLTICIIKGDFDWESRIWIFGFPIKHKISKQNFSQISLLGKPCQKGFQLPRSTTKSVSQILCSIGNPKIQILRSKSRFHNRTHPWCTKLIFRELNSIFMQMLPFVLVIQYDCWSRE